MIFTFVLQKLSEMWDELINLNYTFSVRNSLTFSKKDVIYIQDRNSNNESTNVKIYFFFLEDPARNIRERFSIFYILKFLLFKHR